MKTRGVIVESGMFLGHLAAALLLSTIIGGILAGFVGLILGRALDLPRPAGRFLFDVPYSPLIWGTALVLGLWLNGRMLNRSACWVGLVAVSAFLALLWWDVSSIRQEPYYQKRTNGHYWQYEYEQRIALNGICEDECLGRLLFTTPTVNAVAYSVGAWLALRRQRIRASESGGSLT